MGKSNLKTIPKMKSGKFWQFQNAADNSQKGELRIYGDIADRTWWNDDVTPQKFADDLAGLGDVKEIDVFINSGGGDVFAAQAIGNMLERNPATVTVYIDGLCASAATIVACHADKVIAAADSSYMIHPVMMGICDYLTAEDMKNYLKALDVIRGSIVSLYAKKTGNTEEECAKWMDATTWWLASDAKEHGFVDEVTERNEDAVVENRNGVLFVNNVGMRTPFDQAPDFVRSRAVTPSRPENKTPAQQPESESQEVDDMEIKTADDLRKAYPDLVASIENDATIAERTRIQEIENCTLPGTEERANEAKFDKPVDSASFMKEAIASLKAKQKKQGEEYLDKAKGAADKSGANSVENSAPKDMSPGQAGDSYVNAIRKVNGVK